MSCTPCKKFLYDFLATGIHKDLPLAKRIRHKSISRVLPELTDWMYRIYMMIPTDEFDKSIMTSSKIARRDRTQVEYDYILQSATFNFLRFRLSWITREVDYITTILIENSFIQCSNVNTGIVYAYDYIAYTVPRVIHQLRDIHGEHEKLIFMTTSILIETKEEEGDYDDLYF